MKKIMFFAVIASVLSVAGCGSNPTHVIYNGAPVSVDTFSGRVTAIAVSPDNTTLALGFSDSLVMLWYPIEHKPVRKIQKHRHIINSVAFSPDGSLLAAASGDEVFTITNAKTGQLIDSVVMFEGPVTSVDYSSDGTLLAVGFADKFVEIWDVQKREQSGEFKGHEGVVTALKFRPLSHILYTAGRDSLLFIADVDDTVSFKTKESSGYINALAFSKDGTLFAAGGTNDLVKLWKTEPLTSIGWYQSNLMDVLGIAFLPDNATLIASDRAGTVVFLKITSPSDTVETKGIFTVGLSELGRFKAHDGAVRSIAVSNDGSKLYTGGDDRTLKVWDVKAILENLISQAPKGK
ncbi:WD40 repeat domain-containing protein [bacterium]|nr:WD40 repeat domain-containing protein [bacterium]